MFVASSHIPSNSEFIISMLPRHELKWVASAVSDIHKPFLGLTLNPSRAIFSEELKCAPIPAQS